MPMFVTADGHLGKDAETKRTDKGDLVTVFRFASKSSRKEVTTWTQVRLFGERGQKLSSYLQTGKYVIVTGELKLESWQDATGTQRQGLVLIADHIVFPPPPQTTDQQPAQPAQNRQAQPQAQTQRQQPPPAQPQTQTQRQQQPSRAANDNQNDDYGDIPF